jgi:DNA-binding response OmpR family regulator
MLTGLSILLVEDDAGLREVLALALGTHGARVTSAGTLAEGRAALRTCNHDVVVADLGLPDGHGHTLGNEARSSGVSAVIALTGDRRDEIVDGSSAAGFHLHLAKPIDPDMLAMVVASFGLGE